ncbi:hypothetical protein [Staphylococcus epidermidis]|uniref:hypothetical protein n=1 Tax=Staphylococcus epidermidis TaxID=1282 RepID=UPI00294B7486|nr:hypothetical protein [Staphylococcus epidermidis]
MIIINIILSTQEHGYLYEHGAELLGSIITAAAFLFTFTKMIIDNNKNKKTEEERNQKTLKMLDLISETYIKNIKNIREKLKNIDNGINIKIGVNNKKPTYQINLENIDSTNKFHVKRIIHTHSHDVYVVLESFKIIKEGNAEKILAEYKSKLTTVLINQHINLNLNSLSKINNKINTLTSSLNKVKQIDEYIHLVESKAHNEINTPIPILQEETEEKEKAKQEWLKGITQNKVKEIKDIINELEKNEQFLT